ncbi:MAG: S41 family peptidase [Casimicrobiaceae bacterium]
MIDQGYLRQPTIQGNTVVFVCDDDLWSVPADGGMARRLTAGLGEPATPCLSPDGKWLAFVGRDEQHPEVYLMPAEGGPARRMTWLGPDVMVRGWTREGQILFVTTHGQAFFRNYRAYTLDPAGGLPQPLPLGQVNHLAFGPGDAKVIGRNTADPARWKRYRGGTAGHLWVDANGSGTFRRMSELKGNITSPLWIKDRIYFLSDSEGVGNLYSCKPDGSDLERHTAHDDYYARHASTDGARIVYQCGAQIWRYDPATDAAQLLDIRVPAHRTQAARKFVASGDFLGEFAVHPAGHSLAVDVRGKLYTFGLWEGAVRQHGMPDGARHRHPQWLADGVTLAAISDETGEERVQVWKEGTTRTLPWDVGRVVAMRASPRGARVAIANHRNEVLCGDIDTGTLTVVDHSEDGRTEDVAWSPDGAWIAYSYWTDPRHVAIKLHEVASSVSTLVTQPEFMDYAPAFDPSGKYLYFLSIRTFDPVYDAVQFELSFPRAARPYLIALQADAPPPFDPAPKGLKPEEPAANDASRNAETKDVRVDLPGIARRVAPFPVHEGRFGQIAGVAGNKVIWTLLPIVGAHGRGGHKEAPGQLELFDFDTLRAEKLVDKVDRFVLADDHTTLVIREGKRLRAIAANRKPEPSDAAAQADTPSRKSGWIDLGRVRVSVEPRAEWRQMLREVWRLQRDHFWTPNMSGTDWNGVYDRYAPLLDRVATRGEFSDLVWEMQGELGTSHAYEMGGDHRKPPSIALGQLAAELQLAADGASYEIMRIVSGDPWETGADSPLNAIGVEAQVGDRIVAVNGQPVSRAVPPQALLVHQAGAKVELTLLPKDKDAAPRSVLVTALTDEVPSRYREWVERNREWVHAQSGGRVGYFHLPDMQAHGFAEFHRYFSAECDRDALIVDLRYNRGGHVSQLLLEKIRRKRTGYRLTRWMRPAPHPDESVGGPVVALTNEHAGSDGDIFSHNFKLLGLGTLVGTRTWGGVVGIWPRHRLADGSETTQPEFSFWFNDVGFGVENYGTDPQIEVDNAPHDARTGHDRQLETALATAQELVAKAPPALPDFGPQPSLVRGPLPPRKR